MKERGSTLIAPAGFHEVITSRIHTLNAEYAGHYSLSGRHEPHILELSASRNNTEATTIEMSAIAYNWKTHASLPDMRIMSSALYTGARDQFPPAISEHFHARRFMTYALEHFDRRGAVTHFRAEWISGRNHDAYYAALEEGVTPWEAAASTWTARTLAELGFASEPITIDALQQTTNPDQRPRISATFPRLI